MREQNAVSVHLELCALCNPGFASATQRMPWTPIVINNREQLTDNEKYLLEKYPPTHEYVASL